MTSASFKPSLKRQRSDVLGNDVRNTTAQQKSEDPIYVTVIQNCIFQGNRCEQIIHERTPCCAYQIVNEIENPRLIQRSNFNFKESPSRFSQIQTLSLHVLFVSIIILFLSSLSTSRFVTGELQHLRLHRDDNSYLQNRSRFNRTREEGKHQGNLIFMKCNRDRGTSFVYNIEKQQRGCITKKRRELSGEALERFIRQQKVDNKIEKKLPLALRSDDSTESFNFSQSPETNVSSNFKSTQTPIDKPTTTALFEYGNSIKKGNPLIQSTLPINFQVEVLVEDITTNELLKGLEVTLENHIQIEYQTLIDRGSIENKNNDGVSISSSKTLKLGEVELTLSLVESKWWKERHSRRLGYSSTILATGSLRSRRREIQEGGQSSNTKLMTINADGSVNYSMEVDGSVPTPDDIEKQWSEAYTNITSQNQIQRAIEDAGIEGVIRLERVKTGDTSDKSNNSLLTETQKNTNVGNKSDIGDDIDGEKDISNSESVASLYENNTDEDDNKLSGSASEGNGNDKKFLDKQSDLERPSTLSIIFGFILTGIAALGLVAYAYIFYRKRQKRLKKKKKVKESITFTSANMAVAAAASASKRNQNSRYYSKNAPQSASQSPKTPNSSQIHLNSMMLSHSESEETSYKGLESSIGSEDISDSFANELKLAASLDQEAWIESQRLKDNLVKREVTRLGSTNSMIVKNRNSSTCAPVPSLLSNNPMNSEREDDIDIAAMEVGLEGSANWVKSFPYGDEDRTSRDNDDNEFDTPASSNQWEPYNSVMPSLLEEKKDETNPSEFFSQKLESIEKDLTISGGQQADTSDMKANITDDISSTSDILSEVSELSRYVRRFERRKDRKIKREEVLHQRLGNDEVATLHPSTPQTMSIGMDGRVHKAHSGDGRDRSIRSSTKRLEPNTLSTYADSYRDAQKHDMSILESISFVSDEEGNAEDTNTRSQRLGISPYRRSNDEVHFKIGSIQNQDTSSTNRTRTPSSRTRSTRAEDAYRYSMGHVQDHSKSSSSRLADLRANDAIIDNSNSEVNVNYNVSSMGNGGALNVNNNNSWSADNKAIGMDRFKLRGVNKSNNTDAVVRTVEQQHSNKSRSQTNNNRFDKLRGLFEQKTNVRPEPIYPPGEHWQNGGVV